MNSPSSSLTSNDQHLAEMARLWNQITDKHAVDALLKLAAEEAATSLPFADKSILSHPPMELTDEEKKRFVAMWDNVPPENTIALTAEDSKRLVEWLDNPPPPNERLIKLMTQPSVLERGLLENRLVPGEVLDKNASDALSYFAKKQTDTPIYRQYGSADNGRSS